MLQVMAAINSHCGIELLDFMDGEYAVAGYDRGPIQNYLQFNVIVQDLEDAIHLFAIKMNEWGLYK